MATVAFYKAVHLVEAVFKVQDGTDSTSHHEREAALKRSSKLKTLFPDYQALLTASRIARYLQADQKVPRFSGFTDYLTAEEVKQVLVFTRLFRLEQKLIGFMTDEGRAALQKVNRPGVV